MIRYIEQGRVGILVADKARQIIRDPEIYRSEVYLAVQVPQFRNGFLGDKQELKRQIALVQKSAVVNMSRDHYQIPVSEVQELDTEVAVSFAGKDIYINYQYPGILVLEGFTQDIPLAKVIDHLGNPSKDLQNEYFGMVIGTGNVGLIFPQVLDFYKRGWKNTIRDIGGLLPAITVISPYSIDSARYNIFPDQDHEKVLDQVATGVGPSPLLNWNHH